MEIVSYLREKHKASKIPIVDIYLNKTPPSIENRAPVITIILPRLCLLMQD